MGRKTKWFYGINGKYAQPNHTSAEDGERACMHKLATLEDLQEENRLIVLPCKVGDELYEITQNCRGEMNIAHGTVREICPHGELHMHKDGSCAVWNICIDSSSATRYFRFSDMGKSIFLTCDGAVAALYMQKGGVCHESTE